MPESMAKTKIISYFDRVNKVGYVSRSITQLAVRLGVHRNTISNKLESGFYEDDNCCMFCIDNEELIKGLPTFKGEILKKIKPEIVQSTTLIEQKPIQAKNNRMSEVWQQVRDENKK